MQNNSKRYKYIFLVESKNDKNDSDYPYITKVIDEVYGARALGHKFQPLYMNGKGNYNDKEKRIAKEISSYSGTKSFVFVCVDIDTYEKSSYQLNKEITSYCSKNNYDFIWFKNDIENVFLKKTIEQNQKVSEAKKFYKKGNVMDNIKELSYPNNDYDKARNGQSNILTVLDKYFHRIK